MGRAMPHRKNAKAVQLDPFVALQCVDDLTKNDVDESPHVTMKEVLARLKRKKPAAVPRPQRLPKL